VRAHRHPFGGRVPRSPFATQIEAVALEALVQADAAARGGCNEGRHACGEDFASARPHAAHEPPDVEMDRHAIPATGDSGDRALVLAVNTSRTPVAKRTPRPPPRRRGLHMDYPPLTPQALHTHAGHIGKEQLREHSNACLSPEITCFQTIRLPLVGAHQKCRRT